MLGVYFVSCCEIFTDMRHDVICLYGFYINLFCVYMLYNILICIYIY